MLDYNERTRTATITRADRTQFTLRGCTLAEAHAFHAKYMGGSAAQTRQRDDGHIIEHRMGVARDDG